MISISHRETMSYCSRPVDASHGFVEPKTVPGDCRTTRHRLYYHAGRKGPAKERDRTTSFDRIDSGGRHEGGGGPVK